MSTAVVQEPVQPVVLGAVAGYGENNESMADIEGALNPLLPSTACDVADTRSFPPASNISITSHIPTYTGQGRSNAIHTTANTYQSLR